MAHSKKIWKGVGITVLTLGAVYLLISLFKGLNPIKWFSGQKTIDGNKGTKPDPNDCGGGGRMASREAGCTKPIFSIADGAEQRCWSFEEIGFEPKEGTTIFTMEGNFFPTKKEWYYNFQSGLKYCFTDKKCCLGIGFPANPQDFDAYENICGEQFIYSDDKKKWLLNPNFFTMWRLGNCSQDETK